MNTCFVYKCKKCKVFGRKDESLTELANFRGKVEGGGCTSMRENEVA